MMPISRAIWSELSTNARVALLRRPALKADASIRAQAESIVNRVRLGGDQALRELTLELDTVELVDLRVSDDEFAAAENALDKAARDAIDLAHTNVRRFHEAQIPGVIVVETMPGVCCRRVSHAIESVGLYVPAGTAPLPSAAIMLAVPAAVAGCTTRVMCTPPRPDGAADPAVLVAAQRAGIDAVYKVGGAQAIAAMAYGTETIARVLKIFGPGNAYVTAAKSLVAADPGGAAIDMPAGPSEVLIIADDSATPEFVAADLLAQAEHGVDSQVVLVTTSEALANATQLELDTQLQTLSRAPIAQQALSHSRIIITESLEEAVTISNSYAPEHLILQVDEANTLLPSIRNAGSVFVGTWTPESVGDYCSGTNHVLPTYGYASTYSGLGVDQFMRHMTIQELTRDGLHALGSAVVALANLEGLDAHAAAVTRRLEAAQ